MDRSTPPTDPKRTAAALRSQLNQMAAASQVLERSTESEKGRTYLAVINQSICRMLRIVGRMELDHRLSTMDPIQFSPQAADLIGALGSMSERLTGILAEIGVSFTLHAPAHLSACADSELIQQMLLELIAHTALAGNDISLTVAQKEDTLCFTVRDHGPGKAEGRPELPALLESEEEQTSLHLARQIAELHGGSLVTSPAADQSLSLVVSIPYKKPEFTGLLESPRIDWRSGGFDSVLVTMSQLLPARSFLPENLG